MKKRILRWMLVSFLLTITLCVYAKTHTYALTIIHVPADYASIQAAVYAATNGDTIFVSPGIYYENINFDGKNIALMSTEGSEKTILDGQHLGSVVRFDSGEDRNAVIEGFTIQNGQGSNGGGIYIRDSSPTIRNNVIANNSATSGAGVYASYSSTLIENNIIVNNTYRAIYGGDGAGLHIGGSGAPEILNNIIMNNPPTFSDTGSGGGIYTSSRDAVIRDNSIIGNSGDMGGGIEIYGAGQPLIEQNLIAHNKAFRGGGGIYWSVIANFPGPTVIQNTIVNNDSEDIEGSAIYARGYDGQVELINNIIVGLADQVTIYCDPANDPNPPQFYFNNIYSPTSDLFDGKICTDQTGLNNNISEEPMFWDVSNRQYYLTMGSASIDTADDTHCPANDLNGILRPQGGGCDMGVYETGPRLSFSQYQYFVSEDEGTAVITVTLTSPLPTTATVQYETRNGYPPFVADSGQDYQDITGTLIFAPDEQIQTFQVTIIDDIASENVEDIVLVLSDAQADGMILGVDPFAYLEIAGNDKYYLPFLSK